MRIQQIKIQNFRGISEATIQLEGHTVLIGDNNAGKSTIFEAIDLVLGPDRLSRTPVLDEHDFYGSKYLDTNQQPILVIIEIIIRDLSPEQKRKFMDKLEFWDDNTKTVLNHHTTGQINGNNISEILRVKFIGQYNAEEDDFIGETFYCSPTEEDRQPTKFTKTDKRVCGFLYLRALRTGARALSLERGSLLDIILRLRDQRPKMYEQVLQQLKSTSVATDSEVGIVDVLTGIQTALRKLVPADWGSAPHLRISDLTREHYAKH